MQTYDTVFRSNAVQSLSTKMPLKRYVKIQSFRHIEILEHVTKVINRKSSHKFLM